MSAISQWEKNTFWHDDDDICFVLDQHAHLDFYRVCPLKQQSQVYKPGVHTIYCIILFVAGSF